MPLDSDALEAIIAWVKIRPAAEGERLLLSLPRTGRPPGPLSTRDVARIVAGYATAAGLPEDRRSPHVLRHTFCPALANAGVDVGVIRELAGHADIRTTTIYTAVDAQRLERRDAHLSQARRYTATWMSPGFPRTYRETTRPLVAAGSPQTRLRRR